MVPKRGDIFLVDSTAGYAVMVKFLMQSRTIWHWLIGKILKALGWDPHHFIDEVRFYHVGMVLDNTTIIEQQRYVQLASIDRILSKRHVIWRDAWLTDADLDKLVEVARRDLGEGYDILLIFGRMLAWLTGIYWFARAVQAKEKELCVSRVAYWYEDALGEKFGRPIWHDVTTDDIDNWCLKHQERWVVVSEKEEP